MMLVGVVWNNVDQSGSGDGYIAKCVCSVMVLRVCYNVYIWVQRLYDMMDACCHDAMI